MNNTNGETQMDKQYEMLFTKDELLVMEGRLCGHTLSKSDVDVLDEAVKKLQHALMDIHHEEKAA